MLSFAESSISFVNPSGPLDRSHSAMPLKASTVLSGVGSRYELMAIPPAAPWMYGEHDDPYAPPSSRTLRCRYSFFTSEHVTRNACCSIDSRSRSFVTTEPTNDVSMGSSSCTAASFSDPFIEALEH